MPVGSTSGTESAAKLQARIAEATRSLADSARTTRSAGAPSSAGNPDPSPAAMVNISDAGRAALEGARAYQPGKPQYGNRVYGPGDAHYGSASRGATESDKFQTTSPGHKSVGEIGLKLHTAAHEAAHVVQQSVRVATGDLDGDGRADVAVAGPPSGDIQRAGKARHEAMMSAIQNIR